MAAWLLLLAGVIFYYAAWTRRQIVLSFFGAICFLWAGIIFVGPTGTL